MKELLAFLTSDDFEDFTSQLISQELPGFIAIEGSGGDGGLDGLDGNVAFQMYFPEVKNRNAAHYIKKIDNTLAKLMRTKAENGLDITNWILVVPEDMHFTVGIHLQKVSKNTGVNCSYWGATKLKALLSKYPEIKQNFPAIFLPEFKQDMGEVKSGIAKLHSQNTEHGIQIITEQEYVELMSPIREDIRALARSGVREEGGYDPNLGFRRQVDKRYTELQAKKAASDRVYEMDLEEINERHDEEVEMKQGEHVRRGVLHSGFAIQDIEKINARRSREIERLKIKYGKNLL